MNSEILSQPVSDEASAAPLPSDPVAGEITTNLAALYPVADNDSPPVPPNAETSDAAKAEIRSAFRAARKALAPEVRKKANKLILSKLTASAAFARAKTVLLYAATPHEVNLDDLIAPLTRAGKRVAVPRLTKTPGVMTLWAVRHADALVDSGGANVRTPDITRAVPIEPKDVDLALVPGVAFTATLGRLGQGGGYYDQLLPRLRADAKWIGIAFDIQIAPSLAVASHDVAMHAVVTELHTFGDAALLEPAPTPAPAPNATVVAGDPAVAEGAGNSDLASPVPTAQFPPSSPT